MPSHEPGLGVTRSLGDSIHHTVGVLSEPELSEYLIEINDQALVLASTAVWNGLSPEKVGTQVQQFYESLQAEAAANTILKETFKR